MWAKASTNSQPTTKNSSIDCRCFQYQKFRGKIPRKENGEQACMEKDFPAPPTTFYTAGFGSDLALDSRKRTRKIQLSEKSAKKFPISKNLSKYCTWQQWNWKNGRYITCRNTHSAGFWKSNGRQQSNQWFTRPNFEGRGKVKILASQITSQISRRKVWTGTYSAVHRLFIKLFLWICTRWP